MGLSGEEPLVHASDCLYCIITPWIIYSTNCLVETFEINEFDFGWFSESEKLSFHFSYIRYSNVCAKAVREALKTEFQTDALKRSEETAIKAIKFEGGKPVGK